MTLEELTGLGLPLDMTNAENAIAVESGLVWIAQNTAFVREEGAELPANVKLFLVKYTEAMLHNGNVASESIGGMSQSFVAGGGVSLIRQYADELLSEWYRSAKFIPAQRKWGSSPSTTLSDSRTGEIFVVEGRKWQ